MTQERIYYDKNNTFSYILLKCKKPKTTVYFTDAEREKKSPNI